MFISNELFQLDEKEQSADIKKLIAKRMKIDSALAYMYVDFLKAFNINPAIFKLDKVVIQDISNRYLRDVKRIHANHDYALIDKYKIAGYLTYWICKLKPISVVYSAVYYENQVIPHYINELLAFYIAVGRIGQDFATINTNIGIRFNNDFLEPFLYSLKFRPNTGDALSMQYYLLEKQKAG